MCASLSACAGNNQGGEEPEPTPHVHTWGEYKVDGDYHYRECTVCGKKSELEHHTGGTSTCEHKAVCSICHAEYGALDEHQFENAWHVDSGNQSQHYHECTVCHQKEYANHVFDKEIVNDDCLVGTKTNVCGESNYYYKSCVCGAHSTREEDKFFVTNAHDFSLETVLDADANIASPADCTHPATYYYVCSKCGAFDSAHPEHVFSHGDAKGHTYGTLHEELVTFGTYHTNYHLCSDCGTYFEPVEEGGVTKYVEKTYDEIFDDSKCQYNDPDAGTQSNPYIMTCKEDFYKLRELVNAAQTKSFAGCYFKLMNDVDFNNDAEHPFGTPIAYDDGKPFSGILDGQNHTLSNIYLAPVTLGESLKGDSLALFSRLTEGTIKNLKISNVTVKGTSQRASGLVARLAGGTIENVQILSGHIEGTTECSGLVGCIVTDSQKAVVKNCINKAEIASIGAQYPCLGGIVGAVVNAMDGDYEIDGCLNYGVIDATKADTLGYSGGVIGLVRVFKSGTTHIGVVKNCKNFGDVNSTKGSIGGIAGMFRDAKAEHCYQSSEAKVTLIDNTNEHHPTGLYADNVTIGGKGYKIGHIAGEVASAATAEYNCFCNANGEVTHTVGAGEPLNDEATCYHVGHNNYSQCTICGEVTGEIIPMTEHHMEYVTTETTHEHKCTNAGCTETDGVEPHNFVYQESEHVDPTPSQNGKNVYKCSICNYVKEEVLLYECTNHVLVYNAGSTPTCHSAGMSPSYHCDTCGRYYSDSEGNNQVSATDLVLPVVEHDYQKHDAVMGFAHSSVEYYTCSYADHDESEGKYYVKENDAFVAKEENEIFLNTGSYGQDGYGTEENPYVIFTFDDLVAFKNAVVASSGNDTFSGKFVKLGADIDLTGKSYNYSIGNNSDSKPFSGTFDGDNHTITGFTRATTDAIAFFGTVKNGTVKNLKMANIDCSGTTGTPQRAAGIVGRANAATVINCHILSGSISSAKQAGGIVGFAMGATTIRDCSNAASVSTTGGIGAGGILGDTHTDATVKSVINCVNTGTITGAGQGAGGIVGKTQGGTSLNVSGCTNKGSVTNTGADTGGIVGGTVAKAAGVITVSDCVNEGTVSGVNYVGGIIGIAREADLTQSYIKNCVNKGDVVSSSNVGLGGIAGLARFNIENCSVVYSVQIKGAAASTYGAIGDENHSTICGATEDLYGYIAGFLNNNATATGCKLINPDGTDYVPAP